MNITGDESDVVESVFEIAVLLIRQSFDRRRVNGPENRQSDQNLKKMFFIQSDQIFEIQAQSPEIAEKVSKQIDKIQEEHHHQDIKSSVARLSPRHMLLRQSNGVLGHYGFARRSMSGHKDGIVSLQAQNGQLLKRVQLEGPREGHLGDLGK